MKLLFDTNVVLDVLLARKPFVEAATALFKRVESGELSGWLGATTLTTLFYLISREHSDEQARREIGKLLQLFEVAAVDRAVLEMAWSSVALRDFEDAVLYAAALNMKLDGIVTRNTKDFKQSEIRVFTPDELWKAVL